MSRAIIDSEYYIRNKHIYRINGSANRHIRTDILIRIIDILRSFLHIHCRAFVFRFDLHLSQYTPNNSTITDFKRKISRRIKTHICADYVGFLWVREQAQSENQHYHCVLFLNGSRIRDPRRLQSWIKEIWLNQLGTSCYWSKYYLIERGDELKISEAVYHLSYLAKTRSKGNRPVQTKDYGSTRNICVSKRSKNHG